ncbi:MAG: glycosyltransferase family protein [Chloroflexi bacterium]|nr:glycosyltransferase family protein [Chloroflexota bacterium]
MIVGAIVQARMGSTRLPGKVLLPVCGRPILWHILERIRRCPSLDVIVTATSVNQADDGIARFRLEYGYECFRGSENDVLDRYYQAAVKHRMDVVVRFTGDNPLVDPAVSEKIIRHYLDNRERLDFASNLHPPSYPDGLETEVVSFQALETAWREAREPFQREHVFPFIWDQPQRFRVGNVAQERDLWMTERWTLDYPEDYEFVRAVYEGLYPQKPDFDMDDVFRFLDQHPRVREINRNYAGVNWYRLAAGKLKTVAPKYVRTEVR